jgi:hypothetical protein
MGVSSVETVVPSFADLGNLFFRSFLLSQGDQDAQQHLFFYIAISHPDWALGPEMIGQLKQRLLPQFFRYLSSGWHNPLFYLNGPDEEADMAAEISAQLLALAGALHDGCPMPRERLLELLMGDVIDNDYVHVIVEGGRARPMRAGFVAPDSIHAPSFSHFCHFALLSRSTGAPLYDQLFAELASAYRERSPLFWEVMKRDATAFRLELVLACHNRAYPDQQLETPGFALRRRVQNH